MNTTPASLLERLRLPGDVEAWDRFVRLYTPMIHQWARRAGASPEDAADLVQEVLATLLRALPEFSYDPGRSFRAWLKTITLNRWRQWRARTARVVSGNPGGVREPADEPEAPDFEESEYRRYLVGRAVQVMREEFEPATWRACWATAAEGRPAVEVAAELGVTVNAVYLAKSRVLRRLHQELKGLLD